MGKFWSSIHKEWNYVFTDFNGKVYLTRDKPQITTEYAQHHWTGGGHITELDTDVVLGYVPDKKNWKASLLSRDGNSNGSLQVSGIRFVSTQYLIDMWDKWDLYMDDEGKSPLRFHYEDIHEELNRRGEGRYCPV